MNIFGLKCQANWHIPPVFCIKGFLYYQLPDFFVAVELIPCRFFAGQLFLATYINCGLAEQSR